MKEVERACAVSGQEDVDIGQQACRSICTNLHACSAELRHVNQSLMSTAVLEFGERAERLDLHDSCLMNRVTAKDGGGKT